MPTITPQDRDTIVARQLVERRQEFFRFFRCRLARPEDAEDALQDFCIKAIRAANALEDSVKVDAWLGRIQRNTLTDYYRRRATRQNVEAAFAREPCCEAALDPESEHVAYGYVHNLLPLLRPDYAEIIRRVDLEQTPRQRVAAELGLTTNNVGVRLHRARRALRIEIEHRYQGFCDGEFWIS
uniref:RNA polymerase sigma factor n=1 Tax=Pararhizobium sp. IMCC3301 TaxID=3067904 RepID=UPI0027421F7C|nr:sigma-70 family RNA polymerase sigma factor [Pararhizobium sp. IMCC3301]